MLCSLLSGALFVLQHTTDEPFRCDLLGTHKSHTLLPLALPYGTSTDQPMHSEMSFKCRSSTSLSSQTLAPSYSNSTTNLLPEKPAKCIGLGIHTPRYPSRSFLTPRPSLSSIHSHAKLQSIPSSSPLPPLPAYFPKRYRQGSAMHKAVHPPKRPPRPEHGMGEITVRIVPPSPALSLANLKAFNRSQDSLSSVYSRSISGETYVEEPTQTQGVFVSAERSFSSGSTTTVKRSHLGAMRLAHEPDNVVASPQEKALLDESSRSDINDTPSLHARLPCVEADNCLGDIASSPNRAHYVANCCKNGPPRGYEALPCNSSHGPLAV